MKGDRLIQELNNRFNKPLDNNLIYGVVTSVEPIKIMVDGLPELQPNQIILGELVREKVIKIPKHKHTINSFTTGSGGEPAHTHQVEQLETSQELESIKLWEGLKEGEKVLILRSNNKQLFYVLERVKE